MSATTKPSARPNTSTSSPKSLKTKEIDDIIGRPHFSYKDEIRELNKFYTFDSFEKHVTAQLKDIEFLKNDIVRTWNLLCKLPNKTTNFRKITFQELNLTSNTTNRPLNDEKINDAYNMVNYILSLFIDEQYYSLKTFDNGFLLWMDDKINYHMCEKIYPLYYPNIHYYGIKDIRGGTPNHKESSYGNYRYTSHPHYNSKTKKDYTVPDYSGRKIVDSEERYLGRDMTPEINRQRLAANISEINDHLNKEDSKKSGKKKKKKKSLSETVVSNVVDKAKDAIDNFFKGNDRNSYRETENNNRSIRFFFGMKTKPYVTVYKDFIIKENLFAEEFFDNVIENKAAICKLLENLYGLNEGSDKKLNRYSDLTDQLDVDTDMEDFIIHLSHYMEAVKTANLYDYFPSYMMNSFLYQKAHKNVKKEEPKVFKPQMPLRLPVSPIGTTVLRGTFIDLFLQVDPLAPKELFTVTITNEENKELVKQNIAILEKIASKCINHYYNGNFQKVPCRSATVQQLLGEILNSKYLDFYLRAQDVPSALYDMLKPVI